MYSGWGCSYRCVVLFSTFQALFDNIAARAKRHDLLKTHENKCSERHHGSVIIKPLFYDSIPPANQTIDLPANLPEAEVSTSSDPLTGFQDLDSLLSRLDPVLLQELATALDVQPMVEEADTNVTVPSQPESPTPPLSSMSPVLASSSGSSRSPTSSLGLALSPALVPSPVEPSQCNSQSPGDYTPPSLTDADLDRLQDLWQCLTPSLLPDDDAFVCSLAELLAGDRCDSSLISGSNSTLGSSQC